MSRFTRAAQRRPATVSKLLLALLVSLPLPLLAQRSEVKIEVSDANGKKLAGVAITVTQEDSGFSYEGVTNKKGKHTVAISQPSGVYKFRFEKPGLAPHEESVEIQPGTSTGATITLIDQELRNKQLAVAAFNDGVSLVQANKGAESLVKFQEAAKLDDTLAEAHRLIALVAATEGDLELSGKALDRYLALEPSGLMKASPAAYRVFRARGETDRLPEVRGYLQEIGAAKDIATRVYNEGVRHVKAEEPEAARESFEEALRLDPDLAPAYQSLAALHFNEQNYEQALPYLEQLLGVVPTHGQGLRMAFFSNVMLDHEDAAIDVGKRWFAANTGAADQVLEQAKKHFEANNNDEAARLLGVVLAIEPDLGVAHYQLGKVLAAKGDIAGARQHLQKFLELDPDNAEAEAARAMLAGL